jgi:hypothetical protein
VFILTVASSCINLIPTIRLNQFYNITNLHFDFFICAFPLTVTLISEVHEGDWAQPKAKPDMSILSDPKGKLAKQAQSWQTAFMFLYPPLFANFV